ncbi:hypothetical protein EJV44_24835, partial [Ancylobacter aquaticus]
NPLIDNIISVSIVVRRNEKKANICLYYIEDGNDDDLLCNDVFNEDETVKAVKFHNELAMIAAFFKLLPLINPDYVLDYNGDFFDLKYIYDRMNVLAEELEDSTNLKRKIMQIQRYDLEPVDIERRELTDKFQNKADSHYFTYYIHIDLYRFLTIEKNDAENYQLNTVSEHYLKMNKVDMDNTRMVKLYSENRMVEIIKYNVQDCVLPIELFLKLEILDFLYTQCELLYLCTEDALSNISHKVNVVNFHKALNNTRTDEFGNEHPDPYFFNKFDLSVTSGRDNLYRTPATNTGKGNKSLVDLTRLKRTPVSAEHLKHIPHVKLCAQKQICLYRGGKVLNPKPGMKKWVAILDFNSLYPTIMMSEGVCLSNVFLCDDGNVYLHKNINAINPKLLQQLLNLRVIYKNKRNNYVKDSFQYNLNDRLQNAVKLIANSIYGYFGIFFKPLANYITKIGRGKLGEAIKRIEAKSNDKEILRKFELSRIEFNVIYG